MAVTFEEREIQAADDMLENQKQKITKLIFLRVNMFGNTQKCSEYLLHLVHRRNV